MSNICLTKALKRALKGLSLWWFPMCVLSSVIMFNQDWLPEYVLAQFEEWERFEPYRVEKDKLEDILDKNPQDINAMLAFQKRVLEITFTPEMQADLNSFVRKASSALFLLAMTMCIFYTLLIMVAKVAVAGKGKRSLKDDTKRTLPATGGLFILLIIKAFCIIIFIPGIYFYVRLMFTGIIVTDKSANPLKAIAESWRLTSNEFDKVLGLFLICFVTDIFSAITIVGFIPAVPFKYTLRASVYRQLKGLNDE